MADPVWPRALVARRPPLSVYWLPPLLGLALVLGLFYRAAYQQRGVPISLEFQQGYGLKTGDALRYRGIDVGRVQRVSLAADLGRVLVELRLESDAADLAREGSQFWVVRPQLGLGGISGLETLVGANYLGVLPGDGEPRRHFSGLEQPPLRALVEPGGVEVILSSPGQGQLRSGAPVTYRQVVVGTLLQVDLAADASGVETRAYVYPRYAHLVRQHSRFWKTAGARLSAGWLSGLSVQIDSVQGLLAGGVALATPAEPGAAASSGQRFDLAEEARPEWLEWRPHLPAPGNAAESRPHPLPARLHWRQSGYLPRWQHPTRAGWLLPVADGLLGPLDLLTPPAGAEAASVYLELDAMRLQLGTQAEAVAEGLARLPYAHAVAAWPATRQRRPQAAEDALALAGPGQTHAINRDRYRIQGDTWHLDPAGLDPSWHGAAVVSVADGALLGLLLVDAEGARLARLPAP